MEISGASGAEASPEILAQVTEGFECWNGGELDLMQDMYDPEAEMDMTLFPGGDVVKGQAQLRKLWDELWETWEGIRMDPVDVIEVDRHRYVVDVRLWGKGRSSGIEVDQRFAYLYTIGDGDLIVSNKWFPDVETAVRAAKGP